MSKSSLFSFFSVAALSLGLTIPAGATTVTLGAVAPANAVNVVLGASLSATTPGMWTGTAGSGTANTSVVNSYSDPLAGPGYFAYTEAGSTITADFAGRGITSLDLLWGSPDTYNTITFYSGLDGTGTSESYTPGSGLLAGLTPSQTGGTSVLFTISSGIWHPVAFTSSQNSFEFASLAVVPAPEPASLALIAGGLLAIGAGSLRRRKA